MSHQNPPHQKERELLCKKVHFWATKLKNTFSLVSIEISEREEVYFWYFVNFVMNLYEVLVLYLTIR